MTVNTQDFGWGGKFHGSHTKVVGKFFRILAVGNGYDELGKLSIVFVMNVSSPSCGKWKVYDILCRGNIVIKYLNDFCYIPPTHKAYEQNYLY